ncbi:hypothetical protein [Enterococcus faecium]|uniref:hypothetical protein n=1 Tax=Enterococcus faecium TaxID=1352 RepID=UPI00046E37B5|nr:hypothetical protein [Enterococcus faecium]EMF0544057.1 hypothetical protein [Enterococcus faecium]KZK33838.1 hypothetical protein NP96_08280 [Enterococcus faecium]MCO5468831.1 hypothetical protein [Enterococcus faecium]MDB7249343.1 hypothetical protein [Enterococcus faecium]MDB7302444.1 hypothetical protein [Enterococcus faecium]
MISFQSSLAYAGGLFFIMLLMIQIEKVKDIMNRIKHAVEMIFSFGFILKNNVKQFRVASHNCRLKKFLIHLFIWSPPVFNRLKIQK